LKNRTVLIATVLTVALAASVFVIPALARSYWAGEGPEEGEEFVPPCWTDEDDECPYGYEHEGYEDCPHEHGEEGHGHGGPGCGMNGSGHGNHMGGNGHSMGRSGFRWGRG